METPKLITAPLPIGVSTLAGLAGCNGHGRGNRCSAVVCQARYGCGCAHNYGQVVLPNTGEYQYEAFREYSIPHPASRLRRTPATAPLPPNLAPSTQHGDPATSLSVPGRFPSLGAPNFNESSEHRPGVSLRDPVSEPIESHQKLLPLHRF